MSPSTAQPGVISRAGVVGGWVLRAGPWSLRVDPRLLLVSSLLALLVLALGVLTLTTGTIELSASEVLGALLGHGDERTLRTVVGRRLPRLLTALLVGGSLGVAGSVFQSLSRNALGSPDIIGFTTGAATGAVVQILHFDGSVAAVAASAIAGGVLTALLVYALARKDGVSGGMRLVLVGIGVAAILAAITSFLMVRASITDADTVQRWEAGSLIGRGWPHAVSVLVAVVLLLPAILVCRRAITYLEMGDEAAQALGVHAEGHRFAALLLAVVLTGVAVAATGPIAFIALAAPQVVSRLTRRGGVSIVPTFLLGGLFLTAADLISQQVDLGMRTPVGLITSAIGGLYLIWLLARRA